MDTRLENLIDNYLASVSAAVELLARSGISLPSTNTEWACNGLEGRGELADGTRYFKHGYGCAVHLPTGAVDFDFGESGEVNGFDLWRLSAFAKAKWSSFGFRNEAEIRPLFEAAIESGEIRFSGYILYYRSVGG